MTSKPGTYGIENSFKLSALHPGYWKTLKNLKRVVHPEVAVKDSVLHFLKYPFEPAAVYPAGIVEMDDITEINLGFPSQIRLRQDDILFVPGPCKKALISFINQHDIKVLNRLSVWTSLLDPFLDTWEDQKAIDAQFEWFETIGLDRRTVDNWRREVALAMTAYNFGTGLWEWGSLDLYDVLIAQQARLNPKKFSDFYSRGVNLAAIDPLAPDCLVAKDYSISNTLYSVLIDWYPDEKNKRLRNFDEHWKKRNQKIDQLKQRLLKELTSAYSEPHRKYHTLQHIEKTLKELDKVWQYAIHLNEIRWALLFHDAVYDPHRQDNEIRSADWACRIMEELQRPEDETARVRKMILATSHSNEPGTPDEALLLDIDLSILGADQAAFNEYNQLIKDEYHWVPKSSFRQARERLLQSFFRRESLYHTAPFRKSCEKPARLNIKRALEQLQEVCE